MHVLFPFIPPKVSKQKELAAWEHKVVQSLHATGVQCAQLDIPSKLANDPGVQ